MCDLIQSNNLIILGNNNSNLPQIVLVIAEAFKVKIIKPLSDEGRRLISIVKQIESNPEVFQACVTILSVEQKQSLEEVYRELASGTPS